VAASLEEGAALADSGGGGKEDPMADLLPIPIVACLDRLGQALVQWAQTHHDAPLATHEDGVLHAVRTVFLTLRI
jgi:hypothetical protein